MCNKPDRDVPRMKCGYPLPCPWHTATIDARARTISFPVVLPDGVGAVVLPVAPDSRLAAIVEVVTGKVSPTRKKRRR